MTKAKPKKPYPTYPLTPHASGNFCKKIRGRIVYFGKDPDEALQRYLDEKDDLHAGRIPRRGGDVTTEYLVNAFCDYHAKRVETGEITHRTLDDYVTVGRHVVEHFGRTTDPEQFRPEDFAGFRHAMAKRYHSSRWSKIVTVTRQIVKWGYESELLEKMPRYGPGFKIASKKQTRIEKSKNGKKLLAREEIQKLLEAADTKWRAIILLGINGALGNTDIAELKLSDVGDGDWIDYARGKTGIERRIPLWQETESAIKAAIAERPKSETDLMFVSDRGGPLINIVKSKSDLTVQGFRRLAKNAGVYRKGMGFYWLRHTFQTIGDGAKDPVATSAIMGHADNSMAGQYRETINNERLRAVTDHVWGWLFG